MDLFVDVRRGLLSCELGEFPCSIGRGGWEDCALKTEGDDKTPIGIFPLRRLYYRSDKLDIPKTFLPCAALHPDDGWCDAVDDPAYNQFIKHPYPASAERLWRDDDLYDVVVVLGHNDEPTVPNRGSAIFLHVAKTEGESGTLKPTRGCVAILKPDLLRILPALTTNSHIHILPGDELLGTGAKDG